MPSGKGVATLAARTISATQFALLLGAGYLAVGMFHFPRELVAYGGPEALYAFGLDAAAALFGLWLWFRVNHLQPAEQVSAFSLRLLTPVMGYPTAVLTIALHVVLALLVISNFGWVMITFFLPDTPAWAIRDAVVVVAMYAAWFDTPVLGRTLQVTFVPAFVLSVLLGTLLLGRFSAGYALVPSLPLHPGPIVLAAYHSWYIFWGYEITLTLYPFVRREERPQAERCGYMIMLITIAFYLLGYILTVGVEGPSFLALIQWPSVSAMRLIDISALIINKLGLLVVVFWGLFVLAFEAVRIWCVAHDVMGVLGLRTMTQYRLLIVIFGAMVMALASLFPNVDAVVSFAQTYVLPAMVVYQFGGPVLLLGAAQLRRLLRWPAPTAT
ncbi:MAG: GerAB/ArcD/ProY family transporter [Clostridia bacterium]